MADVGAGGGAPDGPGHRKSRFSLLKGIFVLGLGMFFGFFLAYELINTSGDVLHFGDVISMGVRQAALSARDPIRRDKDVQWTSYGASVTSSADTTPGGRETSPLSETTGTTYTPEVGEPTTDYVWTTEGRYTSGEMFEVNETEAHDINVTTTTELPVKACFKKNYKIKKSCDISPYINYTYGRDVTLENIGHMIFKVELMDLLYDKCSNGEWCLSDDWLLVSDNDEFLDFCYAGPCLRDNTPEKCLDERRSLIISTLLLLCRAANVTANITNQCYLSMRKMTHVSMSMVRREGATGQRCQALSDCSAECQQLARGLYCMNEICDHQKEVHEGYSDWLWYFESDDVTCDVDNSTTCNFLMSPAESWFDNVWKNLKKIDMTDVTDARVLSVIIITAMVMVLGLVASVLACARRGPILKRYSRDTIEYSRVGDDDEDDEVFEAA